MISVTNDGQFVKAGRHFCSKLEGHIIHDQKKKTLAFKGQFSRCMLFLRNYIATVSLFRTYFNSTYLSDRMFVLLSQIYLNALPGCLSQEQPPHILYLNMGQVVTLFVTGHWILYEYNDQVDKM